MKPAEPVEPVTLSVRWTPHPPDAPGHLGPKQVIFNHDPDIRARLGDIKSAKIVAFDENGTALILDNSTGTLRAANTHPDFRGTYVVEWRDQ